MAKITRKQIEEKMSFNALNGRPNDYNRPYKKTQVNKEWLKQASTRALEKLIARIEYAYSIQTNEVNLNIVPEEEVKKMQIARRLEIRASKVKGEFTKIRRSDYDFLVKNM